MKAWERWTFGMLALVVALTGVAYLGMKHLMPSDDPFAVVNHPWQPAMLHLHVLASPPFILVFGMILNSHILKKLRASQMPNRKSGLSALATFGLMVGSGYLLQIVTDEGSLRVLVAVHVASGAVFSMVYVAHLVISVRLMRARSWTRTNEVA